MIEGHGPTIEMIVSAMTLLLAWRAGTVKPEDREIIEAHELVIESLSDADLCRNVELETGKDLRDQLTMQEVEDTESGGR